MTNSGYYRSSDRGKTWKKQQLSPNSPVLSICTASDFVSSNEIYVLTRNALHKVSGTSPIAGASAGNPAAPPAPIKRFEEATFGKLQIAEGRLFVHRVYYEKPKKKNGMELVDYAAGRVDVLNLNTNQWTSLTDELDESIIADFDVSADGETMVVALKDGTIHTSNDRGTTWKNVFHRDKDFFCKVKLSPDYNDVRTICAASAKGYVFLSGDGGETWETRSNGLSRWVHHVNILVNKLLFSPNYKNDKTIFLGKTTGVYKTTDNGRFWRHINVWNPKWGYFVYPAPGKDSKDVFTIFSPDYATDQTLYVTTYGEGVFRSQDAGKTWNHLGLRGKWLYTGPSFSANYSNDKTMFAPAVDGIYRSTDDGATWANVLRRTQFLPKVPFLTLKDTEGREIPLNFGTAGQMKSYGAYDEEIGAEMFRPMGRMVEKIQHPKAYLASYYKFRVKKGSAVEVYFCGTSIEYKCIQGTDMGIVDIEVDGKSRGQFDLYSKTDTFDVTGFLDDNLKKGFHVLRIIATGGKNPASSGKAFTFNAANIKN